MAEAVSVKMLHSSQTYASTSSGHPVEGHEASIDFAAAVGLERDESKAASGANIAAWTSERPRSCIGHRAAGIGCVASSPAIFLWLWWLLIDRERERERDGERRREMERGREEKKKKRGLMVCAPGESGEEVGLC